MVPGIRASQQWQPGEMLHTERGTTWRGACRQAIKSRACSGSCGSSCCRRALGLLLCLLGCPLTLLALWRGLAFLCLWSGRWRGCLLHSSCADAARGPHALALAAGSLLRILAACSCKGKELRLGHRSRLLQARKLLALMAGYKWPLFPHFPVTNTTHVCTSHSQQRHSLQDGATSSLRQQSQQRTFDA